MTTKSFQANEGRLYWQLSTELNNARESGLDPGEIALILADIKGIALHSDSELMRTRAFALLASVPAVAAATG